ncbi:FAD-binding oxidoreductase [Halobacillus amylolyticus]|uniref:FAD-binding oxidoreductase n=1 Tax=Halobacillus amylolyticus TaxID=2932259 RepID=A0ABY4HE56_9BACI|nr:FAD-binding oxidoreductase [Halobacillus amylolyticus]UOR13086.1 FAD-binding oxidoreductase [Halobacillus amylolyticus]
MELKELLDETVIPNKTFGNNGLSAVTPRSEKEIAEILKLAHEEGKKASIISGGTKRGYGGLIEEYDYLLSLANYKGIVEHTVGDMTVTVKPGTTIRELQSYLKEHNQMVSIDPNWPNDSTIGGVIAANESGPKRLKYGSARDLVIGLRVVYPDGSIIRTGGKVVKNVAGYDMNKLFIGSMGTLGVISEITLKLRPTPKYESLVVLSMQEDKLEELRSFAVEIQDSMIEPASLELLNPALSNKLLNRSGYNLLISFEDVENSVHFQEDWVEGHKPNGAKTDLLTGDDAREFWKEFSSLAPNGLQDQDVEEYLEAVLKIASKNLHVLDIIEETQRIQGKYHVEIEAHGGVGHGISHLILKGSQSSVTSAISHMQDFTKLKSGYATIKHLPLKLRSELNVWGETPSYYFLLQGIKAKVDPNNTLNYKRFIGGI